MAGDPLARAAQRARDATAERDRLIREARAGGESFRSIAERAGLTHPAIIKIVNAKARRSTK